MQKLHITHDGDADQRLDKFLKKYLPNAPLGAIYKFLRTGKIKVNGKKKDQMYKIELDDIIELYFQDEEMNIFQQIKKSQQSSGIFQKDSIKDRILYEDEYILVMNKPA
jgi:23S rRNA pseudouridine955/2504/2580 synthase